MAGRRRSFALQVAPVGVYVAYIFVMGSLRNGDPPMHVSDKAAHFVAFGLMVPLFVRALRYFRAQWSRRSNLLLAMALASLAGALLEVWQSFLPYRSADVLDWAADTVGALVAGALVALVERAVPPPGERASDGPS